SQEEEEQKKKDDVTGEASFACLPWPTDAWTPKR
ncbi:CHD2 isoform 29, partial [Pan troglodytes]